MFVPAIWMFGFYVSADVAAGLGAIYIVGRGIYFFSYVKDPKQAVAGLRTVRRSRRGAGDRRADRRRPSRDHHPLTGAVA